MDFGNTLRVVTADGRALVGASFGPETGQPVLFVAGAATSKKMTFGLDLLEGLNIRLLTMDRAGLGDSSEDPHRTLASTASDYHAFLSGVLGEDTSEIPIIANSQGAVFGLMLAASSQVRNLTLVSPIDEIAHPMIRAKLPAEATELADLALRAPDQAANILGTFSAEAMEEMVLAGSDEADAAFYRSPPFLARYRCALKEGFANGGSGYVQDTLIALRPWDIDLGEITCAVQILFGINDLTHSHDLGETLAQRIQGASRTVRADAGGALLWTHAQFVFDAALHGDVGPDLKVVHQID